LLEDSTNVIFEYIESPSSKNNGNKAKVDQDLEVKKLVKQVVNNIEYNENLDVLAQEEAILNNEFYNEANTPLNKVVNKRDYHTSIMDDKTKDKKKEKNHTLKMNGAIMKILAPESTIKLELNGTCYGYYYVEKLNSVKFGTEFSSKFNLSKLNQPSAGNSEKQLQNSKQKFIVDTFIKNISKKIDKKFIEKNDEFRHLIYKLLESEYIINNEIRITYIPPENMVHFNINKDHSTEANTSYGNSVFYPVEFHSKIYVGLLISLIVGKIVRGSDRRVYYVDISEDDPDVNNVINEVVKDIRGSEISTDNFKDMTTIFQTIGQYKDFYIPQIDGNSPISVETLPGMDIDINTDLLELLLTWIAQNLGIPKSILTYEDTDFARTLAIQNGQHVRQILKFQTKFSEHFTKLFKLLYYYNFKYDNDNVYIDKSNKDTKKKRDKKINENIFKVLDLIGVKFNKPVGLNADILSESLRNSQDVAEGIVKVLLGDRVDGKEDEFVQKKLMLEIAKDYIPNIDWNTYEKRVSDFRKDYEINKLDNVEDSESDTSSGGYY